MTAAAPPSSSDRGVFISFEGGDGVGKSTQIQRLAETLRVAGRDVVTTREPGGSAGAEAIRALLVRGEKDRWSPMTEALLAFAARRDHLEKTVLPALDRGAVVITDRFADSSMAYQGHAGGLGAAAIETLYALVVGESGPDLTIVLDAPADEGLRRASSTSRETRFEEKGADFQRRVREAFLDIARAAPERCVVIDSRAPVDRVAARIESLVRERFSALLANT